MVHRRASVLYRRSVKQQSENIQRVSGNACRALEGRKQRRGLPQLSVGNDI